jgi:transcriptional regulator with XRE-family HTH domain
MKHTQKKNNIPPHHLKRLEKIGMMLKEMRFSEGLNQDGFVDIGVTRRQVQRGECGSNLSLISLYKILDVYGYSLDEFFEGMK